MASMRWRRGGGDGDGRGGGGGRERVGGHCDCLALTFASHILPGAVSGTQPANFRPPSVISASRTETRYYSALDSDLETRWLKYTFVQ